jgi:hypothetical protein
MRVDLQPCQVRPGHDIGDTLVAFGLEVEVHIEVDAHVGADRLADDR